MNGFTTARSVLSALLLSLIGVACTAGWSLESPPQRDLIATNTTSGFCVSLSGGGIRSGAVSLGVLQALHQENELQGIESIAAVSGGGYPLYGVITQMIENGKTVEELLGEGSSYVKHVESRAAFIRTSDIYAIAASAALTTPFPLKMEGSGFFGYERKIHETFSGGAFFPLLGPNPYTKNSKLTEAKGLRNRGFPVPIFVTSSSPGKTPPKNGHSYTLADVFELTPSWIGSPSIGYFDINSGFGKWIDTGSAVAMSAAALDTPQGDIKIPAIAKSLGFGLSRYFRAPDDKAGTFYFTLADGGFIDNLGVLPLLRRGCAEIIAFDNSDDSRPFSAWRELKERLFDRGEEAGWRLTKDLSSSELGMSIPHVDTRDVAPDVEAKWKWFLPEHVWNAELEGHGRRVNLTIVKLGLNGDDLSKYPSLVREFASQNWETFKDVPHCKKASSLNRRCSFPLEATARQSFTEREFEAYRELGAWLARLAIAKR